MGKLKLILSDLHLGDGQEEGELNPWEGFHHDEKFAELLRHYSTDYYEDEEVELILAGDVFDLLMVRYDGDFPLEITEAIGVAKLKACLDGHAVFVQALRDFVNRPHKLLTLLPGNHDPELVYAGCQQLIREYVCGDPTDPRVQFVCETDVYEFDGVQVHHGHFFEPMNHVPLKRTFIKRGDETILNLPWGSVFVMSVLTHLKQRRPYIDRVQPFSRYLFGALFFDTGVAFLLIFKAIWVFLTLRILPLFRRPRTLSVWDVMAGFTDYEAFPNFEHKVKRLFKRNPHVHTVIMGHTHLAKVRRLGRNKTYINTGTWTELISLDISALGISRDLTYALVEYPPNQLPRARLRIWEGYKDLWREVHY